MQLDNLSFEEARSLARPAMTYVRSLLRDRLTAPLTSTGAGCIRPAAADPDDRSSGNPMGLLPPMRRQHIVCSLPDQGLGPVLS